MIVLLCKYDDVQVTSCHTTAKNDW